ncbi:MAG: Hsp20/alpha crystallin family protein [Victivallales bacterium]|nr:Hsp20/alpha crystallin family protein [Victivallales bacterium]
MTVPEKHVSEFIDFVPPADVIENNSGIKLMLDMPGAGSDGLNVNIESGELRITADSDIVRCDKTVRYKRSFQISDQVDVQKVTAKLENGVLALFLPKHEHAKIHKVKIEG